MGWHRAFRPGQETTCSLQLIAGMLNLDHIKTFLLHDRMVETGINILLYPRITAV